MTFRRRLTLFFLAIVVVPLVTVAVLVVRVTADSRDGKADASLNSGLKTARALYDEALRIAPNAVLRIGRTQRVAAALGAGKRQFLQTVATRQVRGPDVATVVFRDAAGTELARAGSKIGVATSEGPILLDGRKVGSLSVAIVDPVRFTDKIKELTPGEAALISDSGTLATTTDLGDARLPATSGGTNVKLPGGEFRAASLAVDGAPPGARLVLLEQPPEGFVASEPAVVAILAVFFGLAFVFIILLLRVLHGQVAGMLAAARRIGSGDFSGKVPAEGNDEMAGLAREFNKMSDQLSEQMRELRSQREELDDSVRRIGEAFASGLDRKALLEIVIETALAACDASAGQIALRDHDEPEAEAGELSGEAQARALQAAVRESLKERSAASVNDGDAYALALPLTSPGDSNLVLGTMAVSRIQKPFGPAEHEVLRYLIGQASVSIENIGLHEQVAQQAVTDELTGLSNSRHLREWMERESARLQRFGGELSLVMLDIDDFKQVNDTYGHLQGDQVLEMIGRTLRLESRGIDESARYGGEEFVLALPETPREGALEVAERVRSRIEGTAVEGVDGNPTVNVTASIGVATLPEDADQVRGLIAAADAALYRAKRAGKNRVESAAHNVEAPQGNGADGRS